MKHLPIIHNLQAGGAGYAEVQLYNSLVANRPTGGGTLASKVDKLRAWDRLCTQAREKAVEALS